MANYPQLDDQVGVWKLKEVNDAVMGGYWREASGSVGRALFGGGFNPGYSNVIESAQISSAGNATDFGDLSIAKGEIGCIGSHTRAVFLGGNQSPGEAGNIIDYVTFASIGNAADFGDMGGNTQRSTGVGGNATRGVFTEGTSDLNQIQYITPSSTGNAIDFGDMTISGSFRSGVTSPTRTCFAEGFQPSLSNVIDFIEIATTGNAVDFGDLTSARRTGCGLSSSTRGVFSGGITPSQITTQEFITIASQGTALSYGTLINSRTKEMDSTSNSVRGIVAGGREAPNNSDVIQQMTISVGGATTDFGDLSAEVSSIASNSGSHGGLNNGYLGTRPTYIQGAGRAFLQGNTGPSAVIQEHLIPTLGNGANFGNLTVSRQDSTGFSSTIRGYAAGGISPGYEDEIDYYFVATKGNAADFGNLSTGNRNPGGLSNTTRGVIGGGTDSSNIENEIQFINLVSTGNTVDFGDLTVARGYPSAASSTTRGLFFGGSSTGYEDVIDYITIASAGNAQDFGDLSQARITYNSSCSNGTRALTMGGSTDSYVNTIDFVTVASTGNATDFGDLTTNSAKGSAVANQTRAVRQAGQSPSANPEDTMDFVTIASTGNATDYGDAMVATKTHSGATDFHGGLQG